MRQSRSYSAHFEKFPLSPQMLFVSGSGSPPLGCSAVSETVFCLPVKLGSRKRRSEDRRRFDHFGEGSGSCLRHNIWASQGPGPRAQCSVAGVGLGRARGQVEPRLAFCRQDLMEARGSRVLLGKKLKIQRMQVTEQRMKTETKGRQWREGVQESHRVGSGGEGQERGRRSQMGGLSPPRGPAPLRV